MRFIFCEGKDDVAVVKGLAAHLKLEHEVKVENYDGKDRLARFLRGIKARPEFAQDKVTGFAILRDADTDALAAFASVRDALKQNDFPQPEKDGTFSNSKLRVGVFIVGVKGQGMIEDVCLQSVNDQPEFSCVQDYFDCIGKRSKRANFSSKAKVRVWMASQVDCELYVGKAAEGGYWPWNSPAFSLLTGFLCELCRL